jgi:hypothetical protein
MIDVSAPGTAAVVAARAEPLIMPPGARGGRGRPHSGAWAGVCVRPARIMLGRAGAPVHDRRFGTLRCA